MYKCKECDFETNNISEIANHYQYEHLEENKKTFCNKCGKVFQHIGLKWLK